MTKVVKLLNRSIDLETAYFVVYQYSGGCLPAKNVPKKIMLTFYLFVAKILTINPTNPMGLVC